MTTVHTLNKTPKVEDRFRKDMEGNQVGCDCSDSGKRCQWPEQGSGKGLEKNIYKATQAELLNQLNVKEHSVSTLQEKGDGGIRRKS